MKGLTVQNLGKNYGPKAALKDVSFTAGDAVFTVLLGPGGAGKTTTLRLIAGLEPQTSGQIFLDGQEVSRLAPRKRDLAMIFDNLALYPNKNGFQNLASPLIQRKRPIEEIREKVFAMAAKLNLTLVLDRLPKTMSGGEKQRLALGRALVREPRFFLLDEPLSSLDAPLRFKLRSELKRLQKEEGHSFLMATPDFTEALAVGDVIIVLEGGAVAQVASPKDLYEKPIDTRVALFVGSPRINLFKAGASEGNLNFFGLISPIPESLKEPLAKETGEFTVGVRPENVILGQSLDKNAVKGKAIVVDIESLGRSLAVTISREKERLTFLAPSLDLGLLAIGDQVDFFLADPNSLLAFKPDGRNYLT
jgi:multiple sugar transport system ATP-binding protein